MRSRNLTTGSIWANIASFSLPYMLSYFLQILYGLADLFVIGQYCGVESTTAVSNGAQVMYMFTVIVIGLAMGTTVLTARAVGAGDKARASVVIGNTITVFLLASIVASAVLLGLRGQIAEIMDTPAEAVGGMVSYLTVCFIGIPFIVAYNIISSVFRGLGDSRSPMYFVGIACIFNISLDYLFIGLLGWGPVGAALGTTLSQMVSVLAALFIIRRHRSLLDVRRSDLHLRRHVVADIFKIGVPISLQDGFVQVAFIAITVIANGRGLYDAAAVGIVEKFIGLVFIVPSAMLSTVSAISSQNIGAGNLSRAIDTMKSAMKVVVVYGLVVSLILQFVPHLAVRIFTDDAHVVALGGEYLRGYTWDCIFAGLHFCFSGFFTACGYSIISFAHNFITISCARIPLAYLTSAAFPTTLYPMGLATAFASFFSVLICLAAFIWMRRRNFLNAGKAA